MNTIRTAIRNLAKQKKQMQCSEHHEVISTVNELPSPSGDWQTMYKVREKKYTLTFALSVALFVSTLVFGKVAGLFEVYDDFPDRPADIASYKD